MPSLSTYILPLPEEKEFENLLMAFSEIKYGGSAILYGRSGQKQNGVDVVVTKKDGKRVCIQCKKWERNIKVSDIDVMIAEAEGFPAQMELFVIAVTMKRDVTLQEYVYSVSDRRISQKQFPVDIIFWEDIQYVIKLNADLLRIYYPELYINLDSSMKKVQINSDLIIDKEELRRLFLSLIHKWNIIDMLSVDPFAGFEFQLVIDTDCFEKEMDDVMRRAYGIAGEETYNIIFDFLNAFSKYCGYMAMISEPANQKMLMVCNPFERQKISQHKQEIAKLREKTVEMFSMLTVS